MEIGINNDIFGLPIGKISDSGQGKEDPELKKACQDFEAIFLNYMFQSMKKTIPKSGLFKESHQKEIYDSLLFQKLSEKISRTDSLGLSEALQRQLSIRPE